MRSASTTRRRIASSRWLPAGLLPIAARLVPLAPLAPLALLALASAALLAGPATAAENEGGEPRERLPAARSIPPPEEPLLGEPIDAASYRLGPGDVLVLTLPGVLRESATLVVDAEGGLVLPGSSGRVDVAGHTLERARREVGQALAALVRPRAFALSLREPRRFKVYVVGAVARPGAHAASAVTRVSEVIEHAGGILPGGSERNLTVLRADSLELKADLVAFAALGDQRRNPLLDGGDIVRVPVRTEEMAVFGGVASPGVYEFVPGETVGSAIELAGGLVPGAAPEELWLSRLDRGGGGGGGGGGETGVAVPPARRIEADVAASLELAAGDAIVVPAASGFGAIHEVEVTGEVTFPGSYPIQPGADTVAEILARAGGLTPAANPAGARLLRAATVPRKKMEGGGDAQAESGAGRGAPEAAGGAAARPLLAPAFSDLPPTAREVELLDQSVDGREVQVAWLDDPLADRTLLAGGDQIHVPRAAGRIRVDGRVRAPGWVPFTAGHGVKHYVELAGGYDRNADRARILVQRAGRPAQAQRARGSAPLQDGDTIWVPEREPRSRWAQLRDTIALLAQVATVIIVVDQVAE